MNFRANLFAFAFLCLGLCSSLAFDLEVWKTQYGTPLSTGEFTNSRPKPWSDYFNSNSADCAKQSFLYLGPLGIQALPYDQALSTPAFAAIYPSVLVDGSGLIQNAFGVINAPAGSPADGKVYPGDVILEMEDQRIKTATDVTFPFTVLAQDSRGLEIHAGQLVDAAEGRGAIKLKLIRAALTAYTSPTLTAPTTTAEVTVNVTGQDFVRLTTVSANNCLTNWINPRLENGSGGTLYLNAQTISQQCGYATPQMGKDATGATVNDGATAVTNCIGTRSNSMIEYAVPAGHTTLKFKVQTTGTGSATASIKTRKSSMATTPYSPRQYDASGAPLLPPELASSIETIEFPIPQIGSFGDSYQADSEKVANYSKILAHRLAQQQYSNGSWDGGVFQSALAGLGLLAAEDPAYDTHIRKAAYYCAGGGYEDWAYPRGTKLMFLSEYYLRTRDAGILPGLQKAVKDAEEMVTVDSVCGHGTNLGYGDGSGFIGATGTIATGLAVAAKAPVVVDLKKLDNILERAQELAGNRGGSIPYGRGNLGRNAFSTTPSGGQSWSAASATVLASKIRGGPQFITELFRKKYGAATAYGDVDGGHATESLTFIIGSLSCGIWGDEAHKANMDRYTWRLTLKRDYAGYINNNTNRLEEHPSDGMTIFDAGGYLILLNNHKHNLAITGKPEAQALVFPNVPPTYDNDRKLYWRVLNDWNMVDAALGTKMPSALQPKLAELRAMPLGLDMADRTLAFLQREALNAATLVNGVSGLTSPEKQYYCEMLLGIGHEIKVASIDNPVPTSGLSNYRFSLNGYNATTTWKSWGGPTLASDPASSTMMSGSVTLSDPTGTYLPSPVVLNFGPGNLNPTTTFQVPVDQEVHMNAAFSYTVGGSLSISYTRDVVINPAVTLKVPSEVGDCSNLRKVWIPATITTPYLNWTMWAQLPSGEFLQAAGKREGGWNLLAYENGSLVTFDNAYKAKITGKPVGLWCTTADKWGESPVLAVNLLSGPVLTTTTPGSITTVSAISGGNITSDGGWPVTRRGVCWNTSRFPTIFDNKTVNGTGTGAFTSAMNSLMPGMIYYVRAYATNAVGTSYGNEVSFITVGANGTWTTAGGGSWQTAGNWQNGVIASGTNGIADFGGVTPTADSTISLDGSLAIGGMIFGNASFTKKWTVATGTGGTLSLDVFSTSDPSIAVNGGTAVIDAVLVGEDGFIKSGPGTLILNAANMYGGLTAVNAGILQVNGSLTTSSPVSVAAGATLSGTGIIASNATVNGTLAPGVGGIGTLQVNGALALGGTVAMEVNKTSASCDKVTGIKTVIYGGTLSVTNLSGTLASGDKFVLFNSARYKGAFSTLTLPTLAAGLKWDTSGLMVDGSIQVGSDAAITGQPANQTVGLGVSATFSVTTTGYPAPSFQWQSSPNGTTWTDISGAIAASYSAPPAVAGDNNKKFRCIVSNVFATVTSNAATLTVTTNALPQFTVHPADVVQSAAGSSATFTVAATGTPAPTFQWQVSTNFGGAWTNIAGATATSYTFTTVASDDNKAFRCVATNSQGSATSNSALFIISTVPVWINRNDGTWPTAANWSNNTVANGSGVTADFSRLNLKAPVVVSLDGARTIGSLKFGDATNAFGWTLNTGTGGTLTMAGAPVITVNNQAAALSAVLAGSNGLTKAGSGNLILSSANTYTGGTTLNAGQLTLNHASAIAGGALTITGGALGNSSGAAVTVAGNQAWNGNFAVNGPDSVTLSGAVTLNANRTIDVNAPLTVNGAISGAFSLTKNGAGTLSLGAGNTFTGGLTVNGGRVNFQSSSSILSNGMVTINSAATVDLSTTNVAGSGVTFTVNPGGTLNCSAYHEHIWGLTLNGGTISGTGSGKYGTEDFYLDANVTVSGSSPSFMVVPNGIGFGTRTITVNDVTSSAAADLTLSGAGSLRGTGVLTKAGAGTLLIRNQNSGHPGGTTISAGTIQLDGGSLGSGAVSVASGATLSGNGSIAGATTVNGNLVAGIAPIKGTLAFTSNLTLTSSSVTTMKLFKTGGAVSNDQVTTGATLTCAGTLTVTASGEALALGDTFQLFSAATFSGTFASVNLPALSGGLTWDTSRLYIDGAISLGKKPQTITFGPIAAATVGDAIALNATASSGLPVTYTSSNTSVGVIQYGDQLIATGVGTTTITVSQGGNAFYQAAPNVTQTLTVNASLPIVSTIAVVPGANNTAASGGSNIWDGGSAITERGVCWSANTNPTVADNRTMDGSGGGSFTSTLTGLAPGNTYNVRAYVKNSAGYGYGGNEVVKIPDFVAGGLRREFWSNIGGTAVSDLTSNARFPSSPDSVNVVTSAEAPQGFGDNYGQRLVGWIKPPTTGNYKFYITSDDTSELWLSTNDYSGNKVKIAEVTSWQNYRVYSAGGQSASIALTAGQRYYIEVLHKEGGGGDNLSVAWQKPGDAVPADGSAPIPGQYLEYDRVNQTPQDHWRLDETSGTTLANSGSRALTGSVENGGVVGQAGATSVTGKSMQFDGVDDRVRITAPGYNTNTLSIVAWVKRNGTLNQWSGIVFSRAGNTTAGLHVGTANELRYTWNGANSGYTPSPALTLPDNQWALAAMVVTPSATTLYLRTSTGLQSATNTTSHGIEEFDGDLLLGQDSNSTTRFFKGWLDDVRVYKSALASTEVEEIYTQGVTAPAIAISAPSANATVSPQNVNLNANVTANGNVVKNVEFFEGAASRGNDTSSPYSVTWSNVPVGQHTIFARATYGTWGYTIDSAPVTFRADGYASWIAGYNVGTKTAPTDDPDNDGTPNAVEFVTGSNPSVRNSSPAIQTQTVGGNFIVTFNRTDAAKSAGVQVSVLAGPTPGQLNQVYQVGDTTANSSTGVTVVDNGSAPDTVTVTIPLNGQTKYFAKLQVVVP